MITQPLKRWPTYYGNSEPQDDNRDGVAIRVASERLMRRNQHQRF